MDIQVRFRGLEPSEFLREHAVQQALVHLSRFGRDLSTVVLRIGDLNGPKGGVDKSCHVTVRGPRIGTATIEERSEQPYAAVDVAIERAARSVARELGRVRDERRQAADAAWPS